MANLILGNKLVSQALEAVNDFTSSEVFTSEVNKLWRAKILLDRITRPLKTGGSYSPDFDDKVSKENVLPTPLGHVSVTPTGRSQAWIRQGFNVGINRAFKEAYYSTVANVNFKTEVNDGTEKLIGQSKIVDNRKSERGKPQIIIFNKSNPQSSYQYIILQTVPKEIEYQGESTWAVIHSMGRNLPMYHFTGAENVIQMNISWYAVDPAVPEEVVVKCRLLESWTKADGYFSSPPILEILWGNSDLFCDQYFILTSATYKLSNWKANAKVRVGGTKTFMTPDGYKDPGMLPTVATQELIFRRVSANNPSYQDMIQYNVGVKGINSDNFESRKF